MPVGLMRHRRALLLSAIALAFATPVPAVAQVQTFQFNIPAQSLDGSLRALARASRQQILFDRSLVHGRQAPALVGGYSVDEGLGRLLDGSGLGVTRGTRGAYVVVSGSGEAEAGSAAADNGSADQDIVVVGTNIRGVYPSSSPVATYTAEDVERTGATTTEQFIQRLPQNAGTRTSYATGAVIDPDRTATNGVDLRGLGVGTTLVLLNGRRIASGDRGQIIDVSLIPVAAIERVEVLTDGASAIYGSDAVGGVVNFVLRRDFNGAEARVSYGGVTDGGLRQGSLTGTFGRSWGSGHALLSYNFFSASALEVTDRDYSAAQERGLLTPEERRQNLLGSFSQNIGERFTISGSLGYASRDVETAFTSLGSTNPNNHQLFTSRSETEQIFADVALDYEILPELTAHFVAAYSEAQTDSRLTVVNYKRTPPTTTLRSFTQRPSLLDLTASLDGTVFTLPAGDVRFALGFGLLTEDYSGEVLSLRTAGGTLGRRTTYAYGEIFVPLVGPAQDIPLVDRLELSLAGRYTNYADDSSPALNREFGDSIDPKVGLLWAPIHSLRLRATYGTSFRAPSLIQLDESQAGNSLTNSFSIPFPNGPRANVLQIFNLAYPDLGPERARTYTLGFDFRPQSRPGFRLSGTYYNISYEDRIGSPPLDGSNYVAFPELYPEVSYRCPSAAFIEDVFRRSSNSLNQVGVNLADPQQAALQLFALPNCWITDRRIRNLSLSEQDGLDLSVEDRFATPLGSLRLGATMTLILSYLQRTTPTSTVVSVVDTVTQPVDLRGRLFAGLSSGGFDGTLSVNYVDDYTNPFVAGAPQRVDSWITADLNLSYAFAAQTGPIAGIRVNLSIQNLFDRDPPLVGRSAQQGGVQGFVGFDPANANPLGRVVVLSLVKRW